MITPGAVDPRPGPIGRWCRGRDRRGGLPQVLDGIVAAVVSGHDVSLRAAIEERVRHVLSARAVRIRDLPCALVVPRRPGASDAIALDVPMIGRHAALEVVFDHAGRLDDWSLQLLESAARVASLVLEIERARASSGGAWRAVSCDGAAPLIGSSHGMRALRERIERVAGTDFTILIEGESGSGKELVARQIHELSRRRHGPFVAVNCAAIVETLLEAELFGIEDRTATGVRGRRGKFETADGGTLFLDEVSDLSLSAQAKLLRAIQDLAVERVGGQGARRVDTRIVVATNRKLSELVEHGRFRLDLYYRLSGVEIVVPPLRARREDILELATYFLARHDTVRRVRLSHAAGDALVTYDWPGNVRELERVMERAVALADADEIGLDDLPPAVTGTYTEVLLPSVEQNDTMRAWGSRYARLVLERCAQNKRQACRMLGISYHTLQAYLRGGRRRGDGDVEALHGDAPPPDESVSDGADSDGADERA